MMAERDTDECAAPYSKAYFDDLYGRRAIDWYKWLLIDVVEFGSPGALLDVGCGVGLFVELAQRWGINAVGLDGSAQAIAAARARAPSLELHQSDISESPLPFADGTFSNVTLHQVIAHLPPRALSPLFSECRRVLKAGGAIFVYSPSRNNRRAYVRDQTIRAPLAPSELREQLKAAGFMIIRQSNRMRWSPRHHLPERALTSFFGSWLYDWLSATSNAIARRA